MDVDRRKDVTACEHGHQRRKCPHCEVNALDAEVRRLRAANAALVEALSEIVHDWDGIIGDLAKSRAALAKAQ